MRFRLSRGFTLIELLVVISIIGMLSSVVLASVSAARDKGRIAGGLTFERHTKGALGDSIIAEYNFDNPDIISSPSNCIFPAGFASILLNLKVVGASPCTFSVTTSPLGSGKSLEWDFNNNIYFAGGTGTEPTQVFSKFSLGFWVKSNPFYTTDHFTIQLTGISAEDGDTAATFRAEFDYGNGIRFMMDQGGGAYVDDVSVVSPSQAFDGRWHYVFMSVGSDFQAYVDGKKVLTTSVGGILQNSNQINLFAIRSSGSSTMFIDNLIFYGGAVN
ncbi:MAG: Concanavalin A-like lectin/glucanase superfamily [Candidatus Parcubacteria bacterium]|jgi:prepilin-type N-terminal cleavage/methylation domain-containing protein